MDMGQELELRRKIKELDHHCYTEKINLLLREAGLSTPEQAQDLLEKYHHAWTFAQNVSTSGDSFIVILPKRKARELGLGKGTPVLVTIVPLRSRQML